MWLWSTVYNVFTFNSFLGDIIKSKEPTPMVPVVMEPRPILNEIENANVDAPVIQGIYSLSIVF